LVKNGGRAMKNNLLTKHRQSADEETAYERSMAEPQRKIYRSPELVELGGMKKWTKGSGTGISDSILQLSGELIPGDSGS